MKKWSIALFFSFSCCYSMDHHELVPIASDPDNKTTVSEFELKIGRETNKEEELSVLQKIVAIKACSLKENCAIKHTYPQLYSFFHAMDLRERKIDDFLRFIQLEWLNEKLMSRGEQSRLQKEYATMIEIKSLLLSQNKLTWLPAELSQELPNLTVLDISFNRFELIPAAVFGLKALTTLNISHNNLKMVSHEIGHLKELKNLDLSHNALTRLPKELGGMELMCKIEGNKIDPSVLNVSSENSTPAKSSIFNKFFKKK